MGVMSSYKSLLFPGRECGPCPKIALAGKGTLELHNEGCERRSVRSLVPIAVSEGNG